MEPPEIANTDSRWSSERLSPAEKGLIKGKHSRWRFHLGWGITRLLAPAWGTDWKHQSICSCMTPLPAKPSEPLFSRVGGLRFRTLTRNVDVRHVFEILSCFKHPDGNVGILAQSLWHANHSRKPRLTREAWLTSLPLPGLPCLHQPPNSRICERQRRKRLWSCCRLWM